MRFCFASLAIFALIPRPVSATPLEEAMSSCRHNADLDSKVAACTTVIERSHDRRSLLRAYNTRGLALCDLDRCAEAVTDFDHVVGIDSSIAGYFDNRARALRAANRLSEAVADSDRAIRMAPTYAFTYLGKAHSLEAGGRYEATLAVIEQALAVDPSNAGSWEYRGDILGKLQRYETAYASYSRSLEIDPFRSGVFKSRAETETAQGNLEAALADYARYPSSGDDAAEVARAADAVRARIQAERESAQKLQEAQRQAEAEQKSVEKEAAGRVAAAELAAESERKRADVEKARADAAVEAARQSQVKVALVDPVSTAVPAESTISREDASRLNRSLGEIAAQVAALRAALEEQQRLKASSDGDVMTIDATITLVSKQLAERQEKYQSGETRFQQYLTSIKPEDRDQYTTARAASQAFPRVPYYIPGTLETGEFWIEPTVQDTGALQYQLRFVDPSADYNKVRDTISMSPSELADTQTALTKIRSWSQKAHEAGIRKSYSKRAACFPQADCPQDGSTIDGKSSTEIRFNVYEHGSTAGRIQRNKGRFVEGYNISTDSALLLGAYIAYAKKVAERDFSQGTQTTQDLDKLFR